MSAHSMRATRGSHWWLRCGAPAVIATFMVVFGVSGVAFAFFSSVNSDNFSAATADSLTQGATPTATATGTTVAINFAQVSTTSNRLVASYKINRYAAATPTTVAATFACTRSSTTPNCVESNVPAGTWLYTDTAQLGTNWRGAESAKSFSVAVNSPTISSANPASRGIGGTGQVIAITGSNFIAGTTATFSNGIIGTATFTNSTTLTGSFNFSAAAAGAATITVDNHNGTTATNNTTFTVIGIPTVTSASPASAARNTTQNLIITGTNFISGATAIFSTGITVNSATVTDSTHLTANVTIGGAAPIGAATVAVNDNDGGTAGPPASVFSMTAAVAPPTITSTNPPSRGIGATGQVIAITGTNFIAGTTATLSNGITGTATFTNATTLTGTFNFSAAAAGAATITVDNHNGTTATNNTAFTVNAAPAVSSATPNTGGIGATAKTVVIAGSGFVGTPTVTFSNGVVVNTVIRNSASQITANVDVPATATPGSASITVTNADQGFATKTGAFTVNAGPTFTSITPNSIARKTTQTGVIVRGTNFVSGTTVSLSPSNKAAVSAVTFISPTQMSLTVAAAANDSGSYDVVITNPDGGTVSAPNQFMVTG